MQLDPLLASLLEDRELQISEDVDKDRASEAESARALVGAWVKPVPETVRFADRLIGGPDPANPVRIRVYHPEGEDVRAGLLFIHGGGWSTGSIEIAHEHAGNLAALAGVVVVSIEYRLVPEHPYPAGLDDSYHALNWVFEHADELGIDPARLAIGGGSAGGNLAAAVALRARDHDGPKLALQLLEVPVLDLTFTSPSVAAVGQAFPQLGAAGKLIARRYLTEGVDPRDPYVSPLLADDLSDLPPAVLLAAEIDPVRDDAQRYAERLNAAGVAAAWEVFPGLIHGTSELTAVIPEAARWQAVAAAALQTI